MFATNAYAMAGGAQQQSGGGMEGVVMLVIMFAIFYLLLIIFRMKAIKESVRITGIEISHFFTIQM